jgi:hypothetical protein
MPSLLAGIAHACGGINISAVRGYRRTTSSWRCFPTTRHVAPTWNGCAGRVGSSTPYAGGRRPRSGARLGSARVSLMPTAGDPQNVGDGERNRLSPTLKQDSGPNLGFSNATAMRNTEAFRRSNFSVYNCNPPPAHVGSWVARQQESYPTRSRLRSMRTWFSLPNSWSNTTTRSGPVWAR